ncbi:MAG: hypothetical protein HDR35_11305 [Treponema sp.]|nr:hypothetical protein [Treponema sp.]
MKRFFVFLFLSSLSVLSAQESLEKLLLGYFQNSLTLQELSGKVDKAILNSKSTSISNGMNISLSTGSIAFSFGNGGSFNFTPNASLGIPAAQNLRFTASSNVSARNGESEVKNTSLGVSVDIYSSVREEREIALLKSGRALLEARRDLQNGFVNMESEFYTKLKNLFEIASKIITAQKSLYEHSLEFDELRVQGFGAASSKYRLKQMEVASDEHDVEIYRHELERETKIFAQECGMKYDFSDAMEFLPTKIPEVVTADVLDFDEENFAETESAVWTNKINSKIRAADKAFSLSVNAGYTFANTVNSFMTNAMEYGDTVDIGSSLSWQKTGLQASAGVSFPTDFGNFHPLYKLSFSFLPNQFRLANVQKKIEKVDETLELVAIESARKNYETTLVAQQSSLEELQWAARTNAEGFETYSQLESDTASWYQRGIITESEYRSAQVNKENYRIKILINALDLIIYNNRTATLFTRDEELK